MSELEMRLVVADVAATYRVALVAMLRKLYTDKWTGEVNNATSTSDEG